MRPSQLAGLAAAGVIYLLARVMEAQMMPAALIAMVGGALVEAAFINPPGPPYLV